MSLQDSKWWERDESVKYPRWLFSGRVGLGEQRPAVQCIGPGSWQLVAMERKRAAPLRVGDLVHEYWALADGYLLAERELGPDIDDALRWGASELARIAFEGVARCLEQARRASQAGLPCV